MSIYTPFTYLITHIPTGKRYYGVRYRKGCHPSDIGTKYFSSSKVIKKMIAEDGLDKFKFEVRRTFANADKAIDWEVRVLTRLKVANNDLWLNECQTKVPNWEGKKRSDSNKKKISILHKGKPKSLEHRQKLSASLKGKPLSEERKAKMKGRTAWNKGKKGVQSAWNKGLKGEQSHMFGIKKSAEAIAKTASANKGRKHTDEARKNMSEGRKENRDMYLGIKVW